MLGHFEVVQTSPIAEQREKSRDRKVAFRTGWVTFDSPQANMRQVGRHSSKSARR